MQCPTLALPCNVLFHSTDGVKSTCFAGTPVSKKQTTYVDSMFSSLFWTDFLHFLHLLIGYSYTQKKVFRKVILKKKKKRCGRGTTNWLRGLCCPQRGLATRTHYFVSERVQYWVFFSTLFRLLWLRLGSQFSVQFVGGRLKRRAHPTWTCTWKQFVRPIATVGWGKRLFIYFSFFFIIHTFFNNLLICAS